MEPLQPPTPPHPRGLGEQEVTWGSGSHLPGGDLLCRELEEAAGGDGGVGLHQLRGGEGPAGAATPLVLHRGHHALLPPVHCGGEGGGGGAPGLGGGGGRGAPDAAEVLRLELLLREVAKHGDAHGVGDLGLQSRVLLQVGPEDGEPGCLLLGARVDLAEPELELLELLEGGGGGGGGQQQHVEGDEASHGATQHWRAVRDKAQGPLATAVINPPGLACNVRTGGGRP